MNYSNCKLKSWFNLKIKMLEMSAFALTWPRQKMKIWKEKSISLEKNWRLPKMKARGLIRRRILWRKELKMWIKMFKLFQRLLKRQITRSLLSRPSIKKTKNYLKQISRNFSLVLVTKKKVILLTLMPNQVRQARKKPSKRMLKVLNFQIPL